MLLRIGHFIYLSVCLILMGRRKPLSAAAVSTAVHWVTPGGTILPEAINSTIYMVVLPDGWLFPGCVTWYSYHIIE